MRSAEPNKTSIVREVVAGMEPPYDYKRITLLVNTRIAALPPKDRERLGKADYKYCANKARLAIAAKGNRVTKVREVRPSAPPDADVFGVEELRAAAALLSVCGGSLFRADRLVKLVGSLTTKKGD